MPLSSVQAGDLFVQNRDILDGRFFGSAPYPYGVRYGAHETFEGDIWIFIQRSDEYIGYIKMAHMSGRMAFLHEQWVDQHLSLKHET